MRRENGNLPPESQRIVKIFKLVHDQPNPEVIERGSKRSRSAGLNERRRSTEEHSGRNLGFPEHKEPQTVNCAMARDNSMTPVI